MALMLFKAVPLRNRRALLLYNVYSDNTLLVLNGTSLNSVNALLALSRRYEEDISFVREGGEGSE